MEKIHLLLCGERGAGKTTLIRRMIEDLNLPVAGFFTKSVPGSEPGFHDIFIHPAAQPEEERTRTLENQIGSCNKVIHRINSDVFETVGMEYLRDPDVPDACRMLPRGQQAEMPSDEADLPWIIMDELGFMEQDSPHFMGRVKELLEQDVPVLASIKTRTDLPFLNTIRRLDRVEIVPISERTREDTYRYVRQRVEEIQSARSAGHEETGTGEMGNGEIAEALRFPGVSGTERVSLYEAGGRILAEDLIAPADAPAFRRSLRDGFAVRSTDARDASAENPVCLPVAGCNCAGETEVWEIRPGTAVRIMTGALMPDGADCVYMLEECSASGGAGSIGISIPPAENRYVELPGAFFQKGTLLAEKGSRISAKIAAQAAAAGFSHAAVYRPLRIAFLTTGSELAEPGEARAADQIYETHLPYFFTRLAEEGFSVRREDFSILPDDPARIANAVAQARDRGADVLITSGGYCGGDKDYLYDVLTELGAEIRFRGADHRPGRKCMLSVYREMPVWSLSGKPGAARSAFERFVLPALREMERQKG